MAQTATHPHLAVVTRYLQAIEQDADEATLAAFFAPNIEQHEFPNRLLENGSHSGAAELLAGSRKGRSVVEQQRYAVRNALVDGDRVAVELVWTARLKVPLGKLKVGDEMRASCGVFFRIEDGRILQQHNFDCFDPF
jgi:ketosteroid isomerase-like protein